MRRKSSYFWVKTEIAQMWRNFPLPCSVNCVPKHCSHTVPSPRGTLSASFSASWFFGSPPPPSYLQIILQVSASCPILPFIPVLINERLCSLNKSFLYLVSPMHIGWVLYVQGWENKRISVITGPEALSWFPPSISPSSSSTLDELYFVWRFWENLLTLLPLFSF